MTTQQLVANARKLRKGSHVVALAAGVLGLAAHSLCCWCAEAVEGKATRLPAGGECSRCAYVGADCLVIEPEALG